MTSTSVLTFEGLVPSQIVPAQNAGGDFSNAQFSFSNGTLALVSQTDRGGDGNFRGTNTVIASFVNPSIVTNLDRFGEIASGILRFRYTSPFADNNRVVLRDSNGRVLVSQTLPRTDPSLGYTITPANNPVFSVPFTGNLNTIEFGGVQREFGIDDIQLTNVALVANRPPVVSLAQSFFTVGQGQTIQLPAITGTDDRGLASIRISAPNGTVLTVPNDRDNSPNVVLLEGLSGSSLTFNNISFNSSLVLTGQQITIVATDNEGLSSTPVNLGFNVQAAPVNALPEFRNLPAPTTVGIGQTQPFTFSIFDQDSDRAFLILNAPSGVTLNVPGDTNPDPNRVELNNRSIVEINQALQQATFSSTVPGTIGVDLFLDDLNAQRTSRPVVRLPGITFNVGSERPVVRGLGRLNATVGVATPLGITIEDDSSELTVILTNIADLTNSVAPPLLLTVPSNAPLRDRDGVTNNNYVDLRGNLAQINETLRQITATGLTTDNSTLFVTVQDESNIVREQKELRFTEAVVVSIQGRNDRIKEPVSNETATPGEFVISRTGSTAGSLIVGLSLSGIGNNAERGRDFRLEPDISNQVTIPAGSSSISFRVIPLADDLIEGNEAVNISLLPGNTFNLGNSTASITIEDTPPVVTVRATDREAQEGGLGLAPDPGRFTISRTGLTTRDLPVSFTLDGTATIGEDYQTIPLSVTIPVGSSSVDLDIIPRADNLAEGNETVILNLREEPNRFILNQDRSATITIADRRPGLANVFATQPTAERPPVANRPGIFAISRPTRPDGIQDSTGDFTVNFSLSGSADFSQDFDIVPSNSNGFSFSNNQGQIIIRDARSSETITIVPKADNDTQRGDETVTLTIVNGNSATVRIIDSLPIVTVQAIDPNAKEPPLSGLEDVTVSQNNTTITFRDNGDLEDGDRLRIRLNGSVIEDDLTLTFTGSTLNLNLLPGVNVVEITALNEGSTPPNTAEISIGDVVQSGRGLFTEETVTLNIINTSTEFNPNALSSGSSEFAGIFRINRSGSNNSQDLLVTYNINGTATNGTDFASLGNSVIIPAGEDFVDVIVSPLADNIFEPIETAILTITNSINYTIGSQGTATVAIDNTIPLPTVVILGDDTLGTEPFSSLGEGVDSGRIIVSRSGGDISQSLIVNLSIGGTATNGIDYELIPSSVTIPGGQSSVAIDVVPLFDTIVEIIESVTFFLMDNASYRSGSQAVVFVLIEDRALSTVSIVATDASATEPISSSATATDTGLFTITRSSGDLSQSLVVSYTISGTATNGTDYTSIPTSVTIPGGQSFATISIIPLFDSIVEGVENVIINLSSSSNYIIGSQSTSTVTISDFVVTQGNNIVGTSGADTIGATSSLGVTGTPGNFATNFNDTIDGSDGDDSISGLDGDDRIIGGDDDDRIDGGNGSDTIRGGDDIDTLTGGPGADVFQIEDTDGDIITDFNLVDDMIELLSINFPGGIGTLSSLNFSDALITFYNEFSPLTTSDNSIISALPTYVYNVLDGKLLVDKDGTGTNTFEFIAQLPTNIPISIFNNISIVSSF